MYPRGPTKEILDAIVPGQLISLQSSDGHSIWTNSATLEKAGITKEAVVIGAVDRVSVWAPDRYVKWLDKEGDDSSLTGIYI